MSRAYLNFTLISQWLIFLSMAYGSFMLKKTTLIKYKNIKTMNVIISYENVLLFIVKI